MEFRSYWIHALLSVSSVFILVSLILAGLAQKTSSLELINGPLVAAYTLTLFLFILLSTISVFYRRSERFAPILLILMLFLSTSVVIIGSILIYQSLQAIDAAEEISGDTRMEDVISIETKEYKFTVGAGVIGMVGAILYGVSKIIDSVGKVQRLRLSIPIPSDDQHAL